MFSKPRRLWIVSGALGVMSLATLAGCGLLRDSAPPGTAMNMDTGASACLKGSVRLWGEYLDGKGDPARIQAFWDCTAQNLADFRRQTRGATAGEYTPTEIRGFLIKYFIKDTAISDSLLFE